MAFFIQNNGVIFSARWVGEREKERERERERGGYAHTQCRLNYQRIKEKKRAVEKSDQKIFLHFFITFLYPLYYSLLYRIVIEPGKLHRLLLYYYTYTYVYMIMIHAHPCCAAAHYKCLIIIINANAHYKRMVISHACAHSKW